MSRTVQTTFTLIEPDVMVPAQMLGRCRSAEPERGLQLAVLEQAVSDLRRMGPAEVVDAWNWIEAGTVGPEEAFTFNECARASGSRPADIRTELWRQYGDRVRTARLNVHRHGVATKTCELCGATYSSAGRVWVKFARSRFCSRGCATLASIGKSQSREKKSGRGALLRDQILAALAEATEPVDHATLKKLDLSKKPVLLTRVLYQLVREGYVEHLRGHRFQLPRVQAVANG